MIEFRTPNYNDRKEEDDDFKARPAFFEGVAFRINDAARAVAVGARKAWIHDVAMMLNMPMKRFVPIYQSPSM